MTSEQKFQNYCTLVKSNFQMAVLPHICIGAGLLLLVPLIQGIANLDSQASASCLETYAAMVGIILLVPVFSPEQNREVDEMVSSKQLGVHRVQLLRIGMGLLAGLILIGAFAGVMRLNNCNFPYGSYVLGTFASAAFLGSLGMCVSAFSGHPVPGYLASVAYLLINMMTKDMYVGKFYLMSMTAGSYGEKLWLTTGAVVLAVLALSVRFVKKRVF